MRWAKGNLVSTAILINREDPAGIDFDTPDAPKGVPAESIRDGLNGAQERLNAVGHPSGILWTRAGGRDGVEDLNQLLLQRMPQNPRRTAQSIQRHVRCVRIKDVVQLGAAGLHLGGHGGATGLRGAK